MMAELRDEGRVIATAKGGMLLGVWPKSEGRNINGSDHFLDHLAL